MVRFLPSLLVLVIVAALAPRTAGWQAPPPIVRQPRVQPPPPAAAPRPAETPPPALPARIAPDALARLVAAGAEPIVLAARRVEGRPSQTATISLRPLEVAGVPAVDVRLAIVRASAAATASDERQGVFRVAPFLEPLQLERRTSLARPGAEPAVTTRVLRADGQRFVDPAGSDTSQLVRSANPLLTDTSVIPFAIVLEKRAGVTAVVDFLTSAPATLLVRSAQLTVRAAGRTPEGGPQWLVAIEAPAVDGAPPRALLRLVLDDDHRVRALELVQEGLLFERTGAREPASR